MSRFFYAHEIAKPEDVIPYLARQERHYRGLLLHCRLQFRLRKARDGSTCQRELPRGVNDVLLHRDIMTANDRPIWENVKDAQCWDRNVDFPLSEPLREQGGIAVLRGNLAPGARS